MSEARDALERWVASQLPACSFDELRVLAVRMERMGRARGDYGALNLASDRRNMSLEGAYENVDRGFYYDCQFVFDHDPAFADIREMRRLERIQRFIKADRHEAWESTFDTSDSETTGEWSPVSSPSNTESEESPIVNAAPSEPACVAPAHVEHSPTEGAAPFVNAALAGIGPLVTRDEAALLNLTQMVCDDCEAEHGSLHLEGCSWITVVPANDEVAL